MSDLSLSLSKSDDHDLEEEEEEEEESESVTIDGPNPYEQFNDIFVNDQFLKSSSIMQFAKSLQDSVIDDLSMINDREDFIKYVEAVFRHLRLNPQKFIFFVSKPEPSEKDERELVLIRSDRKVICIRENSSYLLKGHVVHVFFKRKSRIQITMSKGLFMKFTVWKDLENLKSIIPDFLNLSEKTKLHSVEELFFKSLIDLPNKSFEMNHLFKNSFLSLFLTANLEFCRKLVLIEFKEETLMDLSKDLLVIFMKSHLWDHLMRTIIPLYIEKQVDRVESIMIDTKIYLVPCLLNLCRFYYGKKFLPKVIKILHPIVCQRNIDEYVILTFVQLVLSMNIPSQILLIAAELYKAVKAKFPDDELAAPLVVGKYIITELIFPKILENVTNEKEKRRYITFLNVLNFNNEFKEGQHFFDVIKKLYIYLGESEVIVTKLTSVEQSSFSHHISKFFNFFRENASYLYKNYSNIDLSSDKSPVYNEVMELFKCVDKLKNSENVENNENDEEQLMKELNQIHKNIKNGQIKIKRTHKKDIKQIIKRQKQEKKDLLAEIKLKNAEKKKREKEAQKNSKKRQKKKNVNPSKLNGDENPEADLDQNLENDQNADLLDPNANPDLNSNPDAEALNPLEPPPGNDNEISIGIEEEESENSSIKLDLEEEESENSSIKSDPDEETKDEDESEKSLETDKRGKAKSRKDNKKGKPPNKDADDEDLEAGPPKPVKKITIFHTAHKPKGNIKKI